MAGEFSEVYAIDKICEIASESDGVVILTYSLSPSLLESIFSKLKKPKNIRILYSARSRSSQKTLLRFRGIIECCKAVEISGGIEYYGTSHAKIYLFSRTRKEYIDLTAVLGSFNLTYQTLKGIEVYGVYKFRISQNYLSRKGIRHFVEIFSHEKQPAIDLKSLKQNIKGEDIEIGYGILLLLLQLWFKDTLIINEDIPLMNINFFGKENRRMFVSTFGDNTLLAKLRDLLRSAFIYADKTGEKVELLIITPFHTKEAIQRLFRMKEQLLENLGLKGKVKFCLKLLTNSFKTSGGEETKSNYTNPMSLREMMFESEYSPEFQVKFWGYASEYCYFIHAKLYVVKVGYRKAFLLTSANLTVPGLGFDMGKNLEVGVIENHPTYTEELCKWVDDCWESEYAVQSKDDKIWSELQTWYETLEEKEECFEEDFEVEGLTTNLYIYEKNVLKVKNKRKRDIESMELIISFSKKDHPVRNLEKNFIEKGNCFYVEFELREEHLGPTFCEIIARQSDGIYLFILQKKVNVKEKFPEVDMRLQPEVDTSRVFAHGVLPVEIKIEIGRGIARIDLTKLSFELKMGNEKIRPEILLIREKIEKVRTLQFLLWADWCKIVDEAHLSLLCEGEEIATCKIPQSFTKGVLGSHVNEKVVAFLRNRAVRLITDKQTLCPNVKSELQVSFDMSIIKPFDLDKLVVVRDFIYSELIGTKKIRKTIKQEFQVSNRIELDNNIPTYPPTDVEVWVYGLKNHGWTWWIPLGKINYRLLKNPPDVNVRVISPFRTNVTPIEIEFDFKGDKIFKIRMDIKFEVGSYKRQFSTEEDHLECKLPESLDLQTLEEGMNFSYRFIFKYNIADLVGEDKIKYDFFISTPVPSDPSKKNKLVYKPYNLCGLLSELSSEISEDRRLFVTVIPTRTSVHKEFKLQIDKGDSGETQDYFVHVKDGVYALRRLPPEAVNRLESGENFANINLVLLSKFTGNSLIIPFKIFYLEALETDPVPSAKGGYGRSITIYCPDEYGGEFKDEILKITCEAYVEHLNYEHISNIRKGKFSWIIKKDKENEIISQIKDFIEEVRSKSFVPKFRSCKELSPYDASTLSGRKVIDFILFARYTSHTLRIRLRD